MSYPRRGNLTESQVVKIRLEYARGYKSSYQLAAEYGKTMSGIMAIVQGSLYKWASGLITWPGQRLLPIGKVRGHCWDAACQNPIALSGHAQRMHLCETCFRINGGRKCGRTKTGKTKTIRCRECGNAFTYYVRPNGYYPRTCSRKCSVIRSSRKRSKRPAWLTKDALYELYWGRDLTAVEIVHELGLKSDATSIHHWLVADGTPRRARNWRIYPTCAVEGCERQKHKLFNGIRWYGRLCREHLRERDRRREEIRRREFANARGEELAGHISRLLEGLPESVKSDAQSEIMLAVLSDTLALPLTKENVKPFIAAAFRENADSYRFLSLAAPTNTDEGAQTWGERLGLS